MRSYTRGAVVYMSLLVLGAGLVSAYTLLAMPIQDSTRFVPFALLTVLGAIAHLKPLRSARENSFYVVATVFAFAAILLLPAPLLTLHCLLVLLPYTIWNYRRPRVWYRWAFNTAQTLLSAQAVRLMFDLYEWNGFNGLIAVLVVIAGTLFFPVLQGLFVAGIIYVNDGIHWLDAEPLQSGPLMMEGMMSILGVLIAALWFSQPWSLALVPVPMLVVYSLMRRVQMIHLADLDHKTGLFNYRYFEQIVSQELQRAKPVHRTMALVFLDLDHLRHINNHYGHLTGDYVIKEVSAVLLRQMRPGDVVARFGGEEFIALLPGTDRAEGLYLSEQMRRAVRDHHYEYDGQQIRITISAGVVIYPDDGQDLTQLLERADQLLYRAKERGRDRVETEGIVGVLRTAQTQREEPKPSIWSLPPRSEGAEASGGTDTIAQQNQPVGPVPIAHHPTYRAPWIGTALPWIVALAGSILVFSVTYPVLITHAYISRFMVLGAGAIAAEFLLVQVFQKQDQRISVSLGQGMIMAAIASLGLSAALGVALIGSLTHLILKRTRSREKIAFNLGNVLLATGAAFAVFDWLMVRQTNDVGILVALLAASAAYYLVNTGLLHLILSVHTRRTLTSIWRENQWFAPIFLVFSVVGGYLGTHYDGLGLIGTLVFLAPALVLRHSFARYAAHTQASIADLEKAKAEAESAHQAEERTLDQLILTVSAMIDARDRSMSGHSVQVARYGVALAEEMGLEPQMLHRIRIAGLLHDLGKVGVPESILHKPSRLSSEEYLIVQRHALLGQEIVSDVPALQDVAVMIGDHHERFGGGGYPLGKIGDQISIGGRILAVADTLDSILSDRSYAHAKSLPWAIQELRRCSGTQFDPQVVAAAVRLSERMVPEFFINSSQTTDLIPVSAPSG